MLLKVLFTFLPSTKTTVRISPAIAAMIRPYSTAVAPLSSPRNARRSARMRLCMSSHTSSPRYFFFSFVRARPYGVRHYGCGRWWDDCLTRRIDENLGPLRDVVAGRDVLERQTEGGVAGIRSRRTDHDGEHPDQLVGRVLARVEGVGRRRAQAILPRGGERHPDDLVQLVQLLDERRPPGIRVGEDGVAVVSDARAVRVGERDRRGAAQRG